MKRSTGPTSVLGKRSGYKPFVLPELYTLYERHEANHWTPREVELGQDVVDFQALTPEARDFVTKILRFFTQGDIDVASGYGRYFIPAFSHPEIVMWLFSVAAREGVHVDAYSLLPETLGLPETIYSEFLLYQEMIDKHEFTQNLDDLSLAEQIAIVSAFGEGMQLFSSFVMLLNFERHGLLRGVGQIVNWSMVDETLHAEGQILIYRRLVEEGHGAGAARIKEIAREAVRLEDAFIELAYQLYTPENLPKEEVKQYIRFIADRRLIQMGIKPVFKVKTNPLPWVAALTGLDHVNFFERKVTSYSKSGPTGNFSDLWGAKKETAGAGG